MTNLLKEFYDEDNELVALIISSRFENEGIHFFTPGDFSQQLGYMHHQKGKVIPPHIHNRVERAVHQTQEVLFVRKGRVKVDLYNKKQAFLSSAVIEAGDVILLSSGGHSLTMLEPTEIIEVKQGPYLGNRDKIVFSPK